MRLLTQDIQYNTDLELKEFYLTQFALMLDHYMTRNGTMPTYVEIVTQFDGVFARSSYEMDDYRALTNRYRDFN